MGCFIEILPKPTLNTVTSNHFKNICANSETINIYHVWASFSWVALLGLVAALSTGWQGFPLPLLYISHSLYGPEGLLGCPLLLEVTETQTENRNN